tara:strand:+ start:9 stop:545 length:537 start_codon:yes stop_codon:yes gene_type:complete
MSLIHETKQALQVAREAHHGQLRAVGEDTGLSYFDTHVVRVTASVSENAKPAAALHDVIEDTDWDMEDLIVFSALRHDRFDRPFRPATLMAVDLLTHKKAVSDYKDYLFRLVEPDIDWLHADLQTGQEHLHFAEAKEIAREVKIADTMDNLATTPHGPRRDTYLGALHYLTKPYDLNV